MRKTLLLLLTFCLLGCVAADVRKKPETTTVSVVGSGTTRDEAVENALRNAVAAAGVFVYSYTDVENHKVMQDKILAMSRGFVKDYRVTSERKLGDFYLLTVEAQVDSEAIKTIIRKNLDKATYDDVLKDYAFVTQRIDQLNKAAALLKQISSTPSSGMYFVDFTGYEIDRIGLRTIDVRIKVRIALNPFFWNTYYDVLNQIGDASSEKHFCGKYELQGNTAVATAFKLHEDILDNAIAARRPLIIIEVPGAQPATVSNTMLYDRILSNKTYRIKKGRNYRWGCQVPIDKTNEFFIPDGGYEFYAASITLNDPALVKSLPNTKVRFSE